MIGRTLASTFLLALALPAGAIAQTASTDSALAVYKGGAVYPNDFVRGWWNLSPDRRPPGGALKARIAFLSQVVDRKLLAREAGKHNYTLTCPAGQLPPHPRTTLPRLVLGAGVRGRTGSQHGQREGPAAPGAAPGGAARPGGGPVRGIRPGQVRP